MGLWRNRQRWWLLPTRFRVRVSAGPSANGGIRITVNGTGSYPVDRGSSPRTPMRETLVCRRIRSGFEPGETVTDTWGFKSSRRRVFALVSGRSPKPVPVSGGWGSSPSGGVWCARIGSGFYPVRRNGKMRVRVLPGACDTRGWCNGSILRFERRDRAGSWRFDSFPANGVRDCGFCSRIGQRQAATL